MHKPNYLFAIIAILDTILLFILAIIGNKISELLSITPATLLLLAILILIVLSAISYARSSKIVSDMSEGNSQVISSSIPRTMLGLFPVGIILGLLTGTIMTSIEFQVSDIQMPTAVAALFGFHNINVPFEEFIAVLIGLTICFLLQY